MSESLWDRVVAELKSAMKARDDLRLRVMRGLKSDLKYKQIELGKELTDQDSLAVFRVAAKKRRESIAAFQKGGRADRVAAEEDELGVIKEFLPADLNDDELLVLVDKAVGESGAQGPPDFGKVMKIAVTLAAGRADGKRLAVLVTECLKKKTNTPA